MFLPTQTADGGHLFIGTEQPAKEWDCVLIYDEGLGVRIYTITTSLPCIQPRPTQRFILEKLDSNINLTHDRKTSKPPRLPGSRTPLVDTASTGIDLITALPSSLPSTSAPSPSGASPAQTPSKRAQHVHTAADQLEAEVETFDDAKVTAPSPRPTPAVSKPPLPRDPIKSKPIPKIKKRPAPIAAPRMEEEESEGEIIETPKSVKATPTVPTPSVAPIPKPKAKRSIQAAAAALRATNGKSSSVPPPTHHPLPPKPIPSPVKAGASPSGSKRSLPDDTAAPEPKRARISPPPVSVPAPSRPTRPTPTARPEKKAVSLAFPDGTDLSLPSSLGVQQSKPVSLAFPGSSGVAPTLPPAPAPPAPVVAGVDDSEDEEWDPVVEPAAPASAPIELALPSLPSRTITMEEIDPEPTAIPEEEEGDEEEIDMEDFAEQLNEHLNDEDEDEDFLAAAISPVVDGQPAGPIMSLNGYAQAEGNIWGEGDEDDYTSSDSDDD